MQTWNLHTYLHFTLPDTLRHILYLVFFLVNTGVEKSSGVTLGLGRGVFGVSATGIETVDTFLIVSGKSSGKVGGCDDDVAANLFSDIVFKIFFPASFV